MSDKCSQKPIDHTKQSATGVFKTTSKRVIPSNSATVEATGNLVGNKIAEKITKVPKTSPQNNSEIVSNEQDKEIPKEAYISPEERHKIHDGLGLI